MASRNPDAGLCASCAFARVVESARGGRFTLCRRSEMDARFTRYPALPVLECVGFEKADDPSNEALLADSVERRRL